MQSDSGHVIKVNIYVSTHYFLELLSYSLNFVNSLVLDSGSKDLEISKLEFVAVFLIHSSVNNINHSLWILF